MINRKVYMWDTDINSMGKEIRIRVDAETLAGLQDEKRLGGFLSYSDLIKYKHKKYPITAPVSGEGGE